MDTRRYVRVAALGLALAALGAGAYAAAPATTGTTDKGEALVSPSGMVLYTYDKDAQGTSNCNDRCATNWPPLAAQAGDQAEGDWSIIERSDGSRQWAYKGKPLYTWTKDTAPGAAGGDGVGGAWHIATP